MNYKIIEDYVGNEELLLIGKRSFYQTNGLIEKQQGYDEQGNYVVIFYNEDGKIYLEHYSSDYVRWKLDYSYSKNQIVIVKTIIEKKDWNDIITNKDEIESIRIQRFNDFGEILSDEVTYLNYPQKFYRKNFSYSNNKLCQILSKSPSLDEKTSFYYDCEILKYELKEDNLKKNNKKYHTIYFYFVENLKEIKYIFTFVTKLHLNLISIELKIDCGKSIINYTVLLSKDLPGVNLHSKLLDFKITFENYFDFFLNLLEELQTNKNLLIRRNVSEIGKYNFVIKTVIKELNLSKLIQDLSHLKFGNEPVLNERDGILSSVYAVLEDEIDYEKGLVYFKKYYCGDEGILKNGYCIVEDTKIKR